MKNTFYKRNNVLKLLQLKADLDEKRDEKKKHMAEFITMARLDLEKQYEKCYAGAIDRKQLTKIDGLQDEETKLEKLEEEVKKWTDYYDHNQDIILKV